MKKITGKMTVFKRNEKIDWELKLMLGELRSV